MFCEPDHNPYDLKFRLFGLPVRVHPMFWLGAALFGLNALEHLGVACFLVWIGVVFVSILVHELGHALAYRCFGAGAHIVLYFLGGLAVPWAGVSRRWRRIVVSLSGPGAGFALAAVVIVSNLASPWATRESPLVVHYLYGALVGVNIGWGIINLIPVLPLDGGRVMEELCLGASVRKGRQYALKISVAVGALVCVYSLFCVLGERQALSLLAFVPWWVCGSLWTAVLFGLIAAQSYQELQRSRWTDSHWQ